MNEDIEKLKRRALRLCNEVSRNIMDWDENPTARDAKVLERNILRLACASGNLLKGEKEDGRKSKD